jgi:hypothetical protein
LSTQTTVYAYDAFGQVATEYQSQAVAAPPCQKCYLSPSAPPRDDRTSFCRIRNPAGSYALYRSPPHQWRTLHQRRNHRKVLSLELSLASPIAGHPAHPEMLLTRRGWHLLLALSSDNATHKPRTRSRHPTLAAVKPINEASPSVFNSLPDLITFCRLGEVCSPAPTLRKLMRSLSVTDVDKILSGLSSIS